MALPFYFASGTFTVGLAAITPPFPANTAPNDIALLVCESENQPITLTTPNGFAEVLNSPQGTGTAGAAGSTRLAVYWKRLVGGDAAPVVADSGDHTTGQIHVFRNVVAIRPPLASDDCNRADAANPGANWVLPKGIAAHLGIFSTQLDVATAAARCADAYDAGITWPANQYSQARFVALASATQSVLVRAETVTGTTRNYYAAGINTNDFSNNQTHIWKEVASVITDLGTSGAVDITPGAIVSLEAQGTTLICKVNGVPKVTVVDASFAAGKPGLYAQHSAGDVALFDDFVAGDVTVPWNVTAGGIEAAADTSALVPGATTTVPDCLVVVLYSSSNDATSTTNFSAQANVDLGSLAERTDNTDTIGLGGGHGMTTGTKIAAGAYTTTAVTYSVASLKGMLSIALMGASGPRLAAMVPQSAKRSAVW